MKTLIDRLIYIFFFGALATATFSNSLFEITSSVFLALWLAAVVRGDRPFPAGVWTSLLAIYVLVNVLSVSQASFEYDSAKGAFRVLRWALLTLAVTDTIRTQERFRAAFQAILAVAAFIAVDALIQKVTGVEILRGRSQTAFFGETGRITGPFPHANDFSAYLCLAVFAYAGALALPGIGSARRAVLAGGAALVLACLALTYSRGAWLAVAAGLLLWACLRRSFLPVLLLAFFAAGAYAQSPFLFKDRIGSLARSWDGTVSERRLLWSESLGMIRARPVLGFGVNTYAKKVGQFKDPSKRTDSQYAHNGFLQIAAETGLIGLAAFLSVLIFFFIQSAAAAFSADPVLAAPSQGLLLGVAAFLLQSLTDTTLQSLLLTGLLWIWIGLGRSAHRILRTSNAR